MSGEDVSVRDTKETESFKMDVGDNSGPESSPNQEISELKRRQWRARKRSREVAFEYWTWGPAPANLTAAKAAAKELVEQNMYLQWKCEICDFSARGGEEIDKHLGLLKHEKMLAERLRDAVLPPRVPELLEIREKIKVDGIHLARIKELKRTMRAGAKNNAADLPAKVQKKVMKRCELCNRDFISLDGYSGHIKGQKHLKKAAKVSTCNDEFVN